jgi:hypothetical protein
MALAVGKPLPQTQLKELQMAKKNSPAKTAAETETPVADANAGSADVNVSTEGTQEEAAVQAEDGAGTLADLSAEAIPAEAPKPAAPTPRSRGPRGTTDQSVVHLIYNGNPKREGSKAQAVYSCYREGITVGEFCDAVDALGPQHKGAGTPNLVYDTKHGFISIEGYAVPGGVLEVKVKAEKVVKEAKAKAKAPTADNPAGVQKTPEEAAADASVVAAEVAAATSEEVME